MGRSYAYYDQAAKFTPGRLVEVETLIGRDKFWYRGMVKARDGIKITVEIEYLDMADEKHYAMVTVEPKQLRYAKENE